MSDAVPLARLLAAARFAASRHRDQRRKGSSAAPYINHCLEVAELLARSGAEEDVIVAGLLHDTIEDTETTAEEIEARFGTAVRDLVVEVTDDKSLPKARRKRLQVEKTPLKSPGARRIKLADKICNLRDLPSDPPRSWSPDRVREFFLWARDVIEGARGVCPELEREFDEVWKRGMAELKDS